MLDSIWLRSLSWLFRCFPKAFWLQYGRLARMQGFERLCLVLSFDCDTDEDATAAEKLDAWLRQRGIKATYAVPGEQLEQNAAVYRRIAEEGADFINHGGRPHTAWRDDRYWSVTFYDRMTHQEVAADIELGHETVKRIIGISPNGFRAPHFGHVQSRQHLSGIHDTLRQLGYLYSSSTVPYIGFRRGPVWNVGGLYEIPLSGSYTIPMSVLDSWSFVVSPYQPLVRDNYGSLLTQTVGRLLEHDVPGVLNYYVDPAHVYQSDSFYRALEYIVECRVPTLHYGELFTVMRTV